MLSKMHRFAMFLCVTGMIHSAFAADTIKDMTWRLTLLNDEKVVNDSIVTLEFKNNNQIAGRTGCNNYFGSYTLEGSHLKVNENIGSTKAACVDTALMNQEQTFLKLLSQGESIKANDDLDKMVITTKNGETLTFEGIKMQKKAFND